MIWFIHNPSDAQQKRLEFSPARCSETSVAEEGRVGRFIEPGCRVTCEWPRRELTPPPGEDWDWMKTQAERHGLCGSKVVNGKFDTPCGQFRAGRWCGAAILLL